MWNIITFIFIVFKWNWLLPRECYIAIIESIRYAYIRDAHSHAVLSSCFVPSSSQWKTSVFGKGKVISIKQQSCVRFHFVLMLFVCSSPITLSWEKKINTSRIYFPLGLMLLRQYSLVEITVEGILLIKWFLTCLGTKFAELGQNHRKKSHIIRWTHTM